MIFAVPFHVVKPRFDDFAVFSAFESPGGAITLHSFVESHALRLADCIDARSGTDHDRSLGGRDAIHDGIAG